MTWWTIGQDGTDWTKLNYSKVDLNDIWYKHQLLLSLLLFLSNISFVWTTTNTILLLRNSVQLFESDPYGCHSQALGSLITRCPGFFFCGARCWWRREKLEIHFNALRPICSHATWTNEKLKVTTKSHQKSPKNVFGGRPDQVKQSDFLYFSRGIRSLQWKSEAQSLSI